MHEAIYVERSGMSIKKYIKIQFFFISVILFTLIICFGCAGHNSYFIKGKEATAAGDWDESIKNLNEALKIEPDNIEIKLLLTKARWKASIFYMINGEAYLEQKLYKKALELFKKSIAINPANHKAESLIKKTENMKKSDFYFIRGKTFLENGKDDKARAVLERAIKLNPQNMEAQKVFAALTREEKNAPAFKLKLKTDAPISLKFNKTSIVNVFDVLAKLAGINFIFDKNFTDTQVTLFMEDVTFELFLEMLLKTNGLSAKVIGEKTMLVYPDTPSKVKEYQEVQIKTFFLANLEARKAVGLLSRILKIKNIIANEKLNSVIIQGSKHIIEQASEILRSNDKLPSEVLLSVEILEVSRTKEKQFGLEYMEAFTVGVGRDADNISSDTSLVGWISFDNLRKLSNKELIISSPTATLNLLRQDGDTRILANPQIRIKNSEKASILIGERIPLRVNRRVDSSTGDVTSDYQYQDVGVKLEAEPIINVDDVVSLKIYLEVSTLGPNVGTTDDPQYSIQTRSAKSVLTIADGESVVLGGLIKNVENKSVRRIPLLGSIPLLGYLFSSYDVENRKTDIVMVIKPIIIRRQATSNSHLDLTKYIESFDSDLAFNGCFNDNFIIQVGSFSVLNNAEQLKDELEQFYENVIIKKKQGKENNHIVHVGKYSTLQQAIMDKKSLIKRGYPDAFIKKLVFSQ